jgi:hypothetical protein
MTLAFEKQITVGFQVIRCSECDILIALPETFYRRRREDGGTFYCLNGHSQCWKEREIDRLRKQLQEIEREKALADRQRDTAIREREEELSRRREREKELRAIKRRTGNGVCPCCGRSFAALARHMKTKHPEFVKETLA